MRTADYPPQEPVTLNGALYQQRTLSMGEGVSGVEVSIGDHPCESLTVFPADRPDGSVLAFLYGGGWTNGYKEMMSFMAPAFNAAGVTFASIGYRLAPEFIFPTGWLDVGRGVAWLERHVVRYGGDPRRIFVGGHSAGGHYAALLALRRDWQPEVGASTGVIRGCLPISGIYDFMPGNGMAVRPRFLGPANSGYERAASPLSHADGNAPPFLIAYGERDFPHLAGQARRMVEALQSAGGRVEAIELPGKNHFEACYAAGEAQGPWVPAALDWLRRH